MIDLLPSNSHVAQNLSLSSAQIRALAPETIIYTPGGTRRQAALAGIEPHSDAYVYWLRTRMLASLDAISAMNVKHVFQGLIRSSHFAERSAYRERLFTWGEWFLAGTEAIEDWQRRGWRVRLTGVEDIPEMQAVAETLQATTDPDGDVTIWFYMYASLESQWQTILKAMHKLANPTRAGLIQAIYGETIPPASMYISSGKTLVAPDALPLLLMGEMHCYWMQQPGYALDTDSLEAMIVDAMHTRKTWQADKTDRYQHVDEQRALLERMHVLGLGRRIGPFWYPVSEGAME